MARLIKEGNILKTFTSIGRTMLETCNRQNLLISPMILLPAFGRYGYFRDCDEGAGPSPDTRYIITFDNNDIVTFAGNNINHF